MVGSAIVRLLRKNGESNIVVRSHQELDLTNQAVVQDFFAKERPDQVYCAAAKVGGIHANNTYPADFIYSNLAIQLNLIDSAFRFGVKKFLFLGSSCIYPRQVAQPMREDALLTGVLEPTNEPYAIAKIAGIKLCESYNRQYGESHGIDYRSVMPTNLYGPGEGTGTPRREFLFVDDMAAVSIHVMNLDSGLYASVTQPMLSHINVGYGSDISIRELAEAIAKTVDYRGQIVFDASKPDGTPRKLMDSARLNALGWRASVNLEEGLKMAYQDFLKHHVDQ